MTPETYRLLLCIMIPILMILCFIIWQFYCDERNRRKFYEEKYYQDPRVHHYPKKRFKLFRIFFLLPLFFFSCQKEDIQMPAQKECYNCTLIINGKAEKIDTCVDPASFIELYGSQLELNCRLVK